MSADWNKPVTTDTYANLLAYIDARLDDLALQLNSATVAATNLPAGSIRWNSTSSLWQSWSGSAWGNLTATYGISISGNAATATLAASASAVAWSAVTGKPTTVGGYGITDAITSANIGAQQVQYAAVMNGTNDVCGYCATVGIAHTANGGPQPTATGAGAAMLSFHRPGLYGVNFGLDTDNTLKVGGWSMGAVAYKIYHEGFKPPAPTVNVFTASGTWTKPANLSYIKVTVIGGGGGGSSGIGGGGGAGGTSIKWIPAASLGATESVTVGGGGGLAGAGGPSVFGAHCSATGGSPGFNPAGGQGGIGSTGTINIEGGGGGPGGSVSASWYGQGGASSLGGGGAGRINQTGLAGGANTGGGGGGNAAGGSGIVIVEAF